MTLHAGDPRAVGPYAVTDRLGTGGTARVYLAHSRHTGPVALKVMRAGAPEPEASSRREYELMRRVDTRFVPPPVDCGTSPAGAYLATRHLPGYRPLATLAGRVDAAELWRYGYASARAIQAVHEAGVIHCDVKPSNLLTRGGDVRLIDFGIARDADRQPTPVGRIVHCSRGWAAPEQLSTDRLTPAVDVWAWGCVMAYLASGEQPFASETLAEWILRVRSQEPDLHDIPEGLEQLVRWAVQRDPALRPTPGDLLAECRARLRRAPVWRPGSGRGVARPAAAMLPAPAAAMLPALSPAA